MLGNKEGLNFFITVLVIAIVLGILYYFISQNKKLSAGLGGNINGGTDLSGNLNALGNLRASSSAAATGQTFGALGSEGAFRGTGNLGGNVGGMVGSQENFEGGNVYDQKLPYLPMKSDTNNPEIYGQTMTQELSQNPALAQLRQSACFPKNTALPEELLPQSNATMWSESNPSAGSLKDRNFLQSGNLIGINTVGSTMRNSNLQIRSEPPCPQVLVSPWNQTTIMPDLGRKPFEIGGC